MRAYSTDLREKIVMAYESGEGTLDEMASTFAVDRRTVSRLLHRYREGYGLTPKPHGGGYPATLDAKRLELLRQQVEQQPDATLEELAAYLRRRAKVEVHPSTVCRALEKLGLPRKKKSRGCREGRGRPPGFPPPSRPAGSSSLRLHRRNGLSFGHDQSLRTGGTRGARRRERAALVTARAFL
ncbi:MAG: IS630 transposase-related protein [Acidobacteria bacterium]|nr:IS630 transposase-related protein [Acidobacteriota bacterium]